MTVDVLHAPEIIESLEDFLRWSRSLGVTTNNKYYYRGHADKEWLLLPTVYRDEEYRRNESTLYNEMLCSDPDAFKEDNTLFERLTRMQHYGLPTRLLDLTSNPLVALYFSCLNAAGSDGLVMRFAIPLNKVCYPATLPESCLIGISRPIAFNEFSLILSTTLLSCESDILAQINIIQKEIFYFVNSLEPSQELIVGQQESDRVIAYLKQGIPAWNNEVNTAPQATKDLVEFIDEFTKFVAYWLGFSMVLAKDQEHQVVTMGLRKACNDAISLCYNANSMTAANLLCRRWGVENNFGDNAVHTILNDMVNHHFIVPAMNNERLRRQGGAFLVCPPYVSMHMKPTEMAETKVIPSSKKAGILKELEALGISRSQLFPELEIKADELKERFKSIPALQERQS